jgi:16S rRNA G1207 methylase RsmC
MKHQNVIDKSRSYTQNKAQLSKKLYAKKHSELQMRATELAGDTPMNETESNSSSHTHDSSHTHESTPHESTLFDTAKEGIEKAVAYVSKKSPLAKKATTAVKKAITEGGKSPIVKKAIAVEERVVGQAKKYLAAAKKKSAARKAAAPAKAKAKAKQKSKKR